MGDFRPAPGRAGVEMGAELRLASIPVRLGRDARTGANIGIDLASEASHIVMQGATRSGKSVAAYNCLGSLVDAVNVGACEVVGCDPSGLLLGPWGRTTDLIAMGTRYAEMVNVLERIKSEMDQRITSLLPRRLDKVEEFSQVEPLVVVVLEELPGIVAAMKREDAARKPQERLAPRFSALVGELVAQGAKAGVRVVAIAQRASTAVIDGDSRGNFGTRISFRVAEPEAVNMLFPDLEDAVARRIKRFRPGHAFVVTPRNPGCEIIGDFVPDYETYLRRVEGVLH